MIKINKITNGVYTAKCISCGKLQDVTHLISALENPTEISDAIVFENCPNCKNNNLINRYHALINTMRTIPTDAQSTDHSGRRNHNPSVAAEEFTN